MSIISNDNLLKEKVDNWNKARNRLNKALFISGIFVVVICALIYFLTNQAVGDAFQTILIFIVIAFAIYLVYVGIVNLFFLLIEIVDRYLYKSSESRLLNRIFIWFFWISLSLAYIYPILLLTMVLK